MEQLDFSQRWRDGRDSYRPGQERIKPAEYGIELLSDGVAKRFIAAHHYAPNSPPQMISVGLYRKLGVAAASLVGVCRFSVPMNRHSVTRHTGQSAAHGCELGRLVLLDSVPGNAESFFVARAFSVLRQERPTIRAVISYCDPVPRHRDDGVLFKPGHIGTCYQALNGRYVGRSAKRTLLMTRDGQVVSERTLSKFRTGERGESYAYQLLLASGCPPRGWGESPADYLKRMVEQGVLQRVAHPGNMVYCWAVGTKRDRREVAGGLPPALAYPKLSSAI